MITKEIEIVNELGLHSRPASLFVTTASKFKSQIKVSCEDKSGDAKSILNIMMLSAQKGSILEISAEGEDAENAVQALTDLAESGFGEE